MVVLQDVAPVEGLHELRRSESYQHADCRGRGIRCRVLVLGCDSDVDYLPLRQRLRAACCENLAVWKTISTYSLSQLEEIKVLAWCNWTRNKINKLQSQITDKLGYTGMNTLLFSAKRGWEKM